ncbi:MAG: trigger factor [Alphaproteobacteria bacterium]
MQITEVLTEGLHREFRIVVDAKHLDEKLTGRLAEMQPKIHLKGFRPGKAPVSHLKRTFGKSLMGEIVQAAIDESSEKAIRDHELLPAVRPRIDFANEIETVLAGKADLEFTMKVDLMPEFELTDLSALEIERLIADVTDADVDDALQRLADSERVYSPRTEGTAETGDRLTIDFIGRIDGEIFEGGSAENFDLVIGSETFLKEFEDQLTGARAGETKKLSVTFPDDYGGPDIAGKNADFNVTIKAIQAPLPLAMDNEFAKRFGVESMGELKERVRDSVRNRFASASRTHMKRRMLDALDEALAFELPPVMVKVEFEGIWKQVEAELKREGKTPEDEGKSEDELKAEYHAIAERRVRLGLVLSKIGQQNGLGVTEEELERAVVTRARRFPGQEERVVRYYRETPQAMEEIRAPLFEDKVIDFVAELAKVRDRKVDRETLFMEPDDAAAKLAAADDKKPAKKAKGEEKPKAKKKKGD